MGVPDTNTHTHNLFPSTFPQIYYFASLVMVLGSQLVTLKAYSYLCAEDSS